MVFYFTATGNSLQVARALDSAPVSIPQIIRRKDLIFSDDSIGIVYPNHGSSQPPMVRDFITRARFETNYFYMIVTYGRRAGLSVSAAAELCEKCGIHLDYFRTILMVDNYLPKFDMRAEMQQNKHIDEQLSAICSDVSMRVRDIPSVSRQELEAHKKLEQKRREAAQQGAPDYSHGALFSISDSCIGCGVCTRVCPEGDYSIENSHAVHSSGFCQQCLACVHNCPVQAIALTIPEKNPHARYRNPTVTLEDIIRSNRQAQL